MKKRLANRHACQQLSTRQARGCRGGASACGAGEYDYVVVAEDDTYYGTHSEDEQMSYDKGGPYDNGGEPYCA
jgi:hypothetical protein